VFLESAVSVSETIYEALKKLPEPLQAEVLDFVQHLASRVERQAVSEDEPALKSLSLSLAMRGMEHEDTPSYSTEDLKETFS
jgi:hypothetical protein